MGKNSKRSKQVSLTKVKSKGKDLKSKVFQQVSAYLSLYPTVIAFAYQNFKTFPFQKLRESFETSKFLLGKAKVLQAALSSHKDLQDIGKLNKHLSGYCGLLFTKENPEKMVDFFYTWSEEASLLPGQIATETITIPAGVGLFEKFSNTIEPYLRTLGLPTRLHEGKIEVLMNYVVCKAGEPVSVENSKILKLMNVKQGEMRIELKGIWQENTYIDIHH